MTTARATSTQVRPHPHSAGTAAARARKGTTTKAYMAPISTELFCRPRALAGSPASGSAGRAGAVGRGAGGAGPGPPEGVEPIHHPGAVFAGRAVVTNS